AWRPRYGLGCRRGIEGWRRLAPPGCQPLPAITSHQPRLRQTRERIRKPEVGVDGPSPRPCHLERGSRLAAPEQPLQVEEIRILPAIAETGRGEARRSRHATKPIAPDRRKRHSGLVGERERAVDPRVEIDWKQL